MPYVITSACIDTMDQSCVEECPVSCIYVGARKLYIHPDECIDCGACEPVCPVQAISQDRRVAPEETEFIADNRRFFAEVLPGRETVLGSPGGTSQSGDIGVDTPMVAAWG
ncbi:MAG TPA: ferredoxin [Candidatus Dormibacteraeota bacterium]